MTDSLQIHWPKSESEWLGLRKGLMTSSVAAAALGMSPWSTPLDAWAAITGREKFEGNKATVRGSLLEDAVLDYPTRDEHLERKPAPFVSSNWSGDSADCIYALQDGSRYVGEGKTAALGSADGYGEEGTDEVPDHVLIQSAFHLAHHPDSEGAIIPVLIGGYSFEFREYYHARDNELIGNLMDDLAKFHRDYVVADVAPPASAGDDDALKHLWPNHVPDKYLPPTDEAESLARGYVAARAEEKAALAEKKRLSALLRQTIGDAEGVKGTGWKATHKRTNTKGLKTDWEAIARELQAPDSLIQLHTSIPPGHRQLCVSLTAPKKPKARTES